MSNHHKEHDQEDSENHDDCQDCKKQRAQNDKLIAIYEKLQQVDKRTTDIKGSMILHQQEVQKNKQLIKTFQQKVLAAEHQKTSQEFTQFQQFGYDMYAQALINAKKSEAQKQNQRLKVFLKKMQDVDIFFRNEDGNQSNKVIWTEKASNLSQTQPILPSITQKQSVNWFEKGNGSSRAESRATKSFHQTCMQKSFEIFSTKSTFNMNKRRTFEKKDFEELNLWLFQQKNQAIQKELYESPLKTQRITPTKQSLNHKSAQRYKKNAKNATRLGNSVLMSSFMTKQSNLAKRHKIDFLNRSSMGSDLQQQNNIKPYNSSRYINKSLKRGSVLPAIGSN